MTGIRVHFAGPADPRGRLRDLLAERVAAAAPGGSIDWATYYFRDRRLAADLLRARERDVEVRLTLEGHPRTPRANRTVIEALRSPDGLGSGLRVVSSPTDSLRRLRHWRPRLHAKLYCFSGPPPVAFVGSFNPSGDQPELEPDLIREIRDQDQGWNLLVEIQDEAVVAALVRHARCLHRSGYGPHMRFLPAQNRSFEHNGLSLYFWPRLLPDPISARLGSLARGDRVRLAASHVSGETAARTLRDLARRGVQVEMLTGDTERRVPAAVEAGLADAGVVLSRISHADDLPMHDKFLLAESATGCWTAFGSFNWTERSRRHNQEIGIIATDPVLYETFLQRWETIRDYRPL